MCGVRVPHAATPLCVHDAAQKSLLGSLMEGTALDELYDYIDPVDALSEMKESDLAKKSPRRKDSGQSSSRRGSFLGRIASTLTPRRGSGGSFRNSGTRDADESVAVQTM